MNAGSMAEGWHYANPTGGAQSGPLSWEQLCAVARGGGLSPDGRRWVSAKKFLLHHKALGDRCRNLFKARLQQEQPELFSLVPTKVWTNENSSGCSC